MRNLVYYVATSTDGFIAREDGSFDFALNEGEHLGELFGAYPETVPGHLREMLGVHGDNKRFDAVLMGRHTYEVGLNLGITNPYPSLDQYLFSRSMTESPDEENVTLISNHPLAFVKTLKQDEGKDIWLCGGGKLASALFSEIDELILKVNPVILGSKGIPLFTDPVDQTNLILNQSKIYNNGFMLLHYRLVHGPGQ